MNERVELTVKIVADVTDKRIKAAIKPAEGPYELQSWRLFTDDLERALRAATQPLLATPAPGGES